MKREPPIRRQVFVLTPDEKKAVACVLGVLVLGLATMRYRAAHPRAAPPPVAEEQEVAETPATKPRKSATPRARRRKKASPAGDEG